MTKGLSRKQIIISMDMNNAERVMSQSNIHITNINRLLKGVKSEISADYIHSDNKRIVITTNKAAIFSDLNIIEKYIKELNNVDLNNIMNPRLLQSYQEYSIKYIYSTSQISKLSLTLRTFSITGLVAGLFLTNPSSISRYSILPRK